MTNIKIMERINNLINQMDYKKAYIEVETSDDRFVIEKNKRNQIGFRIEEKTK